MDSTSQGREPSGDAIFVATLCEDAQVSTGIAQKSRWLIDLDGVIWLAGEPIDGVREAIGLLREHGVRVVFATRNAPAGEPWLK